MSKTPRTVAIPGEPLATAGDDPVDTGGAVDAADAPTEGAADPEVEALRAQLAAAQAQNQALQAQVAARQAVSPKAHAMPVTTPGGVVLTDKGWVVPETFGSPTKKA